MLQTKPINRKLPEYRQVVELFKTAFPKEEQMPLWLLRGLSHRRGIEFLAFFDNTTFCGLTYFIRHDHRLFLLFFAVDGSIRSKGYGSQILTWLKTHYPDDQIILEIETVDPAFDNYQQRQSRQKFYFKNGFKDTGVKTKEQNVVYDILSNSDNFSAQDYKDLIRHFSFGLMRASTF